MDQNTARKLFEEGAFLILQDVPQGTEFGMDWNSWVTGPKFKGIKMIPPGLHFIFYSSRSKHGGQSPRSGFFRFFKQREILISKWNPRTEEVVLEHKSSDEIEAVRSDLKNLDKYLGPYPYDTLQKWVSLTDHIGETVLLKLQPESGVILSVPELIPDDSESGPSMTPMSDGENGPSSPKKRRHGKVDEAGLPVLKSKPGTEIKFTEIPEKWFPSTATPREMSIHSVDSSYVFNLILETYAKPEDLLGELQFAFICFVLGQVLDAFEQWKNLFHIFCACDESLSKHQKLYESVLSVFYHQINEIPKDFFVDIVSSNNFLVSSLSTLFGNMDCDAISPELRKRSKQYRKYLTKKFRWDFESEPDDWAPVVVET